jgi:hypothetical protein
LINPDELCADLATDIGQTAFQTDECRLLAAPRLLRALQSMGCSGQEGSTLLSPDMPHQPGERLMSPSHKKRTNSTKKVNKKSAKAKKFLLDQKLEMLNPNAAGIDVASEEMWVCVPPDRVENNVRKFGAFTCDLHAIADWLTACGVTTVAMESTGIYWIPLYQVLETHGHLLQNGHRRPVL